MITMNWTVTLQISGSPTIATASPTATIQAVDRIVAVVEPGDADKVLEVQPGAATEVHLLLVKSTRYGSDLSFKVSDGATDSDVVTLDTPQLFSGGAIALFGLAPQQLKFTNTGADPATVEIHVAREAAP
jgi:hypothetical protein